MKKLNGFLAILVVVLVFGLAFVSCDNGTTSDDGGGVPKTIEGLFDELKDFRTGGYLYAYDSSGTSIDWCREHQRWEPWIDSVGLDHNGTPAFDFADAIQLNGEGFFSASQPDYTNALEIIRKLDAFFEEEYKLDTAPYNAWSNAAAGTPVGRWYSFSLKRDGVAAYGSSATPSISPFMAYYYQF